MSGLHNHYDQDHQRGTLTQRAALASVTMALFLLGLKIWAAAETGSVAMLGSLADTGLDIMASLVTLYSVRLAAVPADHDHRFGHGKAEALAALFQTGIIVASAIAIGWRGISMIGTSSAPERPELGIAVSLVAIVTTFVLILYQRSVVRRTGSIAIQADHVHYSSDLLLNAAVIAALVVDAVLGFRGADPLLGVVIAAWLIWHARAVASSAIDQLMDKEWPLEKRERFLIAATSHPDLQGVHDVRTRSSGTRDFAQFHVWVDGSKSLKVIHDAMDELEARLMVEFPGAEIIIHPEPDDQIESGSGETRPLEGDDI